MIQDFACCFELRTLRAHFRVFFLFMLVFYLGRIDVPTLVEPKRICEINFHLCSSAICFCSFRRRRQRSSYISLHHTSADWVALPEQFKDAKKLYFCEYDLMFFKHREQMLRHLKKVRVLHPPGIEIYRHNGISMFEVDGSKAETYCQNLCCLAKLFLDHKNLEVGISEAKR